MTQPKPPADKPNVVTHRSDQYRDSYANSVQVRISVWDFFLVFGIMRQETADEVQVENLQGSTSARNRPRPWSTCSGITSPSTSRHSAPSPSNRTSRHRTALSTNPVLTPPAPRDRTAPETVSARSLALLYPLFVAAVYLSHLTLLRLPYFWDEAGYYIPAAWDFFRTDTLIPVTTASNAHPPLPSLLLAAWWHLAGFVPLATRTFICLDLLPLCSPFTASRATCSAPCQPPS